MLRSREDEQDETRLRIDLSRVALWAGEALEGVVTLQLHRAARLHRLWIEVQGRELLGVIARHAPAVYRVPAPRPWGRMRTGALRLDFTARRPLLGPAPPEPLAARLAERRLRAVGEQTTVELPAGRHTFPFTVPIPAETLPSYGGAGVLVEHEVGAVAEVVGSRAVRAWAPFHLWRGDGERPTGPLVLAAPSDPTGLLGRLATIGRPSIRLSVRLPAGGVKIGSPVALTYTVSNPERLALAHLVLELTGLERYRHRAATEEARYLIARRLVPLGDGAELVGQVIWHLPPRLAPTLRSPRFSLRWLLRATVTAPWRLGVSGEAMVPVWDERPREN